MFTGIVERMGHILSTVQTDGGLRLVISAGDIAPTLKLGDSVAISGVCLTVVETGSDRFAADVVPETCRRTTLSTLGQGAPVNLERCLAAGDRLGGHIVQGHVDGVGTVAELRPEGNGYWLRISAPSELLRYIVPKGSVALDGVSLTVAALAEDGFALAIIPHTAAVTTLGSKRPGDGVNLETDVIGRYVERLLSYTVE